MASAVFRDHGAISKELDQLLDDNAVSPKLRLVRVVEE
jgi:hypothetical protein